MASSSLLFLLCSAPNPTISHDFSISLIHRDSPMSPLYNSSMILHDRLLASARRSISRAHHLHLRALNSLQSNDEEQPPKISSTLLADYYEYIVSYKIGTPTFLVSGMLDTGSESIWGRQGYFFIPFRSSSSTNEFCDAGNCVRFGSQRSTCAGRTDICTCDVRYRDGTKTSGVLSYDKFAFDSPDGSSLLDVGYLMFGCSTECSKEFEAENGCLGLNREQFSLISQLQIKRFSHCMVFPQGPKHEHVQNRMFFGSKAVVSRSNLTPFVKDMDSAYYVTLDGISIGQTKVPIPEGAFHLKPQGDGGVIVDAGITLSMLISEGFDPLLRAMSQIVQKPVSKSGDFEMCFKDLGSVPDVIFHFSTNVDVRLKKENTFIELIMGFGVFRF
ncbi:probable aspartic protease At2g35615 [Neltuma alba]|uniref:probable aspartic protease At2g35615 n=1 Tax=Neltuma alba TaxID=207710 RepID=UPI0010A513F8|nr:probable aspartic protease At2g35615 [Prosopis alba]